jgi:glycosyltransferase involved in cell wall biosynthesis
MKILQAPVNIVNIPCIISNGFKKNGHLSHVVEYSIDDREFNNADIRISKRIHQDNNYNKLNYLIDKFKIFTFAAYALAKYDIFQFHTRRTLLPNHYDIFLINKLKNKKYFIYHHGSDVTGNKNYYKHVPHAKGAKAIFISTPDLYDCVPKSCILIPQAININELNRLVNKNRSFVEPKNNPIIITHAIGSFFQTRKKKGTDLIIDAIKILKNKGINIEFKLFIGKPNDLVLNAIANSDIHIDQIGIGWYGTITAEAMAMGTPVICDIRKDLEKYVNSLPIQRASNNNLISKIEELIFDTELRKRFSIEGIKYAQKNHDGIKIAKKLLKIYNI